MVTDQKYDVVVAGYTCIDLTPEFRKGNKASIEEILKPGQLTEIEGISFLPGGVVPNTAMALKRFNRSVYLNGLVGDDIMGAALSEWLGRYGMDEGIQVTGKEGTGFSIVLAPPGVDRIFLEATGCNKIFDKGHINYEAVSRSRMFHFGYPPLLERFYRDRGSQLTEMFAEVQASGAVTSLDFSLPDSESESSQMDWREILSRVLPLVDICAPSLEEALQMVMPEAYARIQSLTGQPDMVSRIPLSLIREMGRKFISNGVKILIVKAAHRGAYLICGDISFLNEKLGNTLDEEKWSFCEMWCDAYPAEEARVKNATGAGDTAIAAFLSAILDGNGPQNSLRYACLAGRNSLYCNNLYEELRDWENMTQEITEGSENIIGLNGKQS